ncbi:MAG TPA: serine/threonine-protein kinase [Phycisphaerae bacterium]|nr:serine/threonine-protein kinase [Phycisphaerae bacterium]
MADQPFTGSLKPGTKLGKYEVREQVAAGGMAVIYKAYDPSLDRHVAIKQIAPHLAQDARFAERFRSEAQTLARLSGTQANIVNVHELIEQDGQLYLVMEYVEGTTLRAMMDRGPVPLQTGLGVLLSTALGLRAMHAQSIVHRDLTPMNVMMARDGALKITDFGLIGHSGGRTSLPMGTTKYMAPEMFTGAPVDPRADLYSLGLMAYEMFAGPEKFAEVFKDVLRDERAQQVRWMHWHANASLRAPSLKEIQPGIPPLISKIVERMMEKDPSKRFASADQIIRWLRRIFVMHVQGKSISLSDSETLEKEMESEAGAAGVPAVRAANVPAAPGAGAGVPAAGEKTAPLPQPRLTWKKAAFWAAVIAGPLLAAAIGLLVWDSIHAGQILERAEAALASADALYNTGEYGKASAEYAKFVRTPEFRRLPQMEYARSRAYMAAAENALAERRWDEADGFAIEAVQTGARSDWGHEFRQRLADSRKVEMRVGEAKRAEQGENYDSAIAILQRLQAECLNADQYAGLNVGEWVADLQYKRMNREYQNKILEGKAALEQGNLDMALRLLQEARERRETPEVVELIQQVTDRKEFAQWQALGDRSAAEKKWAAAADAYAKAHVIQPGEAIKTKMNNAKAEDLAGIARGLKTAGVKDEARKKWIEILQYSPQHPEALREIRSYDVADQLDGHLNAGRQAMNRKEWEEAVRSFEAALPLLDSGDPRRKGIEDILVGARYEGAMTRAREAFGRHAWDEARAAALQAQGIRETPDVTDLLARLQEDQNFYQGLDLGKELMAQGKIVDAIKQFEALQRIRDTQEVRNLADEARYGMHLAKGKYYLSQNEPGRAIGYFQLALDYANDAKKKIEIQALLQEANRLIEAEGKG